MKAIKLTLIILFSVVIFSSCKTSGSLVIGSWKCTAVKQSSALANTQEKTANSQPSEIVENNSPEGNSTEAEKSVEKQLREVQSAFPDIMSAFVINTDKTATVTYLNKTLSGKWTQDSKTNAITVTDGSGGGTVSFSFQKINANTLKITKGSPSEPILLLYKKQ